MLSIKSALILGCVVQFSMPLLHAESGPAFIPDGTFTGSTLAGWHSLGSASWTVSSGEIIGKGGEGWLVLDKPYQDSAFYTSFRCTVPCNTGILMRMEKRDAGSTGLMLAIEGDALVPYRVNIDADGKITDKTRLRNAGGQARYAPPPSPSGGGRPRATPPPLPEPPQGVTLMPHPPRGLQPGWNQVEVLLDAEILRAFLNDGGGEASAAAENMDDYGPMALYIGSGSEVEFKDIAWKNLAIKSRPDEVVGAGFRMQRINEFFYGWSAAAADFNRDGILDVVSGPYIYFGPDYTKSREIYLGQTLNPSTEYAENAWMEFAADFAGDGWPDVLTCKFGGPTQGCYLYVNARGEPRRWDVHRVIDKFDSEIAVVRDIDGNGKPALVYSADGYVRYAEPDLADVTKPWIVHNVSERGYGTAHGIGAGDINGDGRMDILNAYGWWEPPPAGSSEAAWKYHPVAFGRYGRGKRMGGSVMAVYDVNGDGLNDVVTVLDAHGWGMAWFEQKRDAQGNISFVQHMIMDDFSTQNAGGVTFSEAHGTTYADVNGDGIPDFIVGKRYWSHRDDQMDVNPYGTPVLYWYETVRDAKAPGGARFVPHLIDNRSGAGSDILAVDLNRDGKMDVVTATRFGTFIFWNRMSSTKRNAGKEAPAK